MPWGAHLYPFSSRSEVIVGRDMRLSSPAIKAHLLRGLTEQGADVIDIGMVSTDQYATTLVQLLTSRDSWSRRRTIRLNTVVLKWCATCRICSAEIRVLEICVAS